MQKLNQNKLLVKNSKIKKKNKILKNYNGLN